MVIDVCALTKQMPTEERFVAITQIRRAAWSVINNIAEGNAKLGRAERRRFLDVALGSLAEIDTMVGTIPAVMPVDADLIERISKRRESISKGIWRLKRNGR